MLKRMLILTMVGALFLCLSPLTVRAEKIHYPNETSYYDPAKSYGGVHLFTPLRGLTTWLVDMDGRVINKWRIQKATPQVNFVVYGTLEENGALSRSVDNGANTTIDPNNLLGGGAQGGLFQEVGWSGGVLRTWNAFQAGSATGPAWRNHHRYDRIYNKKLKAWTYLLITWEMRTQAEGLGLGGTKAVSSKGWSNDAVYELDYAGNVVWKWGFFDHTCQSTTPGLPNYVTDVFLAQGKFNVNQIGTGLNSRGGVQNDWHHINSMGYDPVSGHVVMNSREFNEFFVVDHDGTFVSATDFAANIAAAAGPAGDFKYRFGNPANYNAPDFTVGTTTYACFPTFRTNGADQIWGAHGVHYIKPTFYTGGPAMPGAGNIIVMDNGGTNSNPLGSASQLLEVNGYVTGAPTGPPWVWPTQAKALGYKMPHDGVGYTQVASAGGLGGTRNQSHQVVWKFRTNNAGSFSSGHISGVQRLPNGNTIGTSGESGNFFEVTKGVDLTDRPESWPGTSPELVWEYQNPIAIRTVNGVVVEIPEKFSLNPTTSSFWQVFCSFRYGVDYPGLKNRVVQYPDGTILPLTFTVPGVGHTITGQVPCRNIPCQYVGTP